MRLYLSSHSPWNSTYSNEEGHLVFKIESTHSAGTRLVSIYRALPDISLPTSERQLWEERHFFETHPSTQRGHPELDGQGSGLGQEDLILEESRDGYSSKASSDSVYDYPLADPVRRSPSPSRTIHSETHPFWTKEHWVHFADIKLHPNQHTVLNIAGKEFEAEDYFEKEVSKSPFGRSRFFTAWDGHRYRWDLSSRAVKLFLLAEDATTESGQELVAEFHPAIVPSYYMSKKTAAPPCLVIYPSGEPIIDLIISTFVYGELRPRESSVDGIIRSPGLHGAPLSPAIPSIPVSPVSTATSPKLPSPGPAAAPPVMAS